MGTVFRGWCGFKSLLPSLHSLTQSHSRKFAVGYRRIGSDGTGGKTGDGNINTKQNEKQRVIIVAQRLSMEVDCRSERQRLCDL